MKPHFKRVLKEGGETALIVLKAVHMATDAFPPLQSAAGGALHIATTVKKFKSNQKEWVAFGQYTQDALAAVLADFPTNGARDDLVRDTERLRDTISAISEKIDALQSRPASRRLWSFLKDPDEIIGMKAELDAVFSLFNTTSAVTARLDLTRILEAVDKRTLQQHIEPINTKLDHVANMIHANTLQYVNDASWNPNSACLPGTREELLDEISERMLDNPWDSAVILLVTAVAGSGKSALSHSVAKRCRESGVIPACFFFDRETTHRNDPRHLITSLRHHLASLDMALAEEIQSAIRMEPDLPTASITRQFQKLVSQPLHRCSVDKPIVWVIDALDEGYDQELLQILCNEVPKLPPAVRIFLTTRSDTRIDLLGRQHVISYELDIRSKSNLTDITLYARHRLQEVAFARSLDKSWPNENLLERFVNKAGGLFLWVATVSDYLRRSTYPDKKLESILSDDASSRLSVPAEEKMDKLYANILSGCDWEDNDFVEGYHLIMGAIMGAKSPLSITALKSLHRDIPHLRVKEILRPFASLIEGLTEEDQPLRLVHKSFRDFLTLRARNVRHWKRFAIRESRQSVRLAYLCLLVLKDDLIDEVPELGYLSASDESGGEIPSIDEGAVSEALRYACRFWMDHIADVRKPQAAFRDALQEVLAKKIVTWVEITVAMGRFQTMAPLRQWLKINYPHEDAFTGAVSSPELGKCMDQLCVLLRTCKRWEESLEASLESVKVCRLLAAENPALRSTLAISLNKLSIRRLDLEYKDAALSSSAEAVEICRSLAAEYPAHHIPELAACLNIYSRCLSDMGNTAEALIAIREAVDLYRALPASDPASSTSDAAEYLTNLSRCLSDLGLKNEALDAADEAVEVCRALQVDRPDTLGLNIVEYLVNLSRCLSELDDKHGALEAARVAVDTCRVLCARHVDSSLELALALLNLSFCSSELGHIQDAVETGQEALFHYRTLATRHPTFFHPRLAECLNNLAADLSKLGHMEDAVEAAKEAVDIRRALVADQPAAFRPSLANSLNNLFVCLLAHGNDHLEDALSTIKELVGLHRALAQDQPSFNHDLAMSLNNLSLCLSGLDRGEDALEAVKEAVNIHRTENFAIGPSASLASYLNNLSNCLSKLGRKEDALEAIKKAVEIFEALAVDDFASFNPDLASSIHNLSIHHMDLGHHQTALNKIMEAVKLRRGLAAQFPAKFNPLLASSLSCYATCLLNFSRDQEQAIHALQEAVELYRQAAADHSDMYSSRLVQCLTRLSVLLADQAHEASEEAARFGQNLSLSQARAEVTRIPRVRGLRRSKRSRLFPHTRGNSETVSSQSFRSVSRQSTTLH